MSNKNIKDFGKTFQYLNNPDLRRSEASDALLTVEGALFSGAQFRGQTWRNVKFVGCDFVGGYEIKLQATERCEFESCKFAGIFDFGVMNNVRFYKCQSGGASNWGGQTHSKNVVFEACQFIGADSNPNHQGAIGSYGEAVFLDCKVKWFDLVGDTGLIIRGCELEDVACHPDVEGQGAHVLIEKSKLRGEFRLAPAHLLSFAIRDTVWDRLNLSGATMKGDFVMERVRGGSLDAWIKGAPRISIRDSQFTPTPGFDFAFELVSADTQQAVIERVRISGGEKPVSFGFGALGSEAKKVEPKLNQSFTLTQSQIDRLDASYLNSSNVRFERNTIDSLDLSHSRIGKLELTGNTIARSVDFTDTQVEESQVQPLAKGQARLDGSNVKPR